MTYFSSQESHVQILPSLACQIGLNEAIVLQHLHEQLDSHHMDEGQPWIRCSFKQWQAQLPFWSKSKLMSIFYSLEKQNLILIHRNNNKRACNRYSINYDLFNAKHRESSTVRLSSPRDVLTRSTHRNPSTPITQSEGYCQ